MVAYLLTRRLHPLHMHTQPILVEYSRELQNLLNLTKQRPHIRQSLHMTHTVCLVTLNNLNNTNSEKPFKTAAVNQNDHW